MGRPANSVLKQASHTKMFLFWLCSECKNVLFRGCLFPIEVIDITHSAVSNVAQVQIYGHSCLHSTACPRIT